MKTMKYIVMMIGAATALSFSRVTLGHGDADANRTKKETTLHRDKAKETPARKSESSTYSDETSRAATIETSRDERAIDPGSGEKRAPDSEYYHR